jgi:hypothetical protein
MCLLGATPFLVPTSWPHYFSYMPALQLFAFDDLASETAVFPLVIGASLLAGSVVLGSTAFLLLVSGNWARYSRAGFPFLSDACLVAFGFARMLRRIRPEESGTTDATVVRTRLRGERREQQQRARTASVADGRFVRRPAARFEHDDLPLADEDLGIVPGVPQHVADGLEYPAITEGEGPVLQRVGKPQLEGWNRHRFVE